MKIAVIGTGYTGLTTGACLAEKGHDVICIDKNIKKIFDLKKGRIPFYEPDLEKLVKQNLKTKKLEFSTNIKYGVRNSEATLCCVWTPPDKDFKPSLSDVFNVAKEFGLHLNGKKVFVIKSTVPVGTNEKCKLIIQNELKKRKVKFKFDIVANPEFLRQGSAVKDTFYPDRIVAGIEKPIVKKIIKKIYKPFIKKDHPIVFMSLRSAELTKYAANAFLATKISFINEMANFCELTRCNIHDIEKALKLDKRIGPDYLDSGIGYGGNCLRKDINALIQSGNDYKFDFDLLEEVEEINEKQKLVIYKKLKKLLKNLKNKKIAVWGVTFKPDTDEIKEAPSVKIIDKLLKDGAKVFIYDPIGSQKLIDFFGRKRNLINCDTALLAAKNADALLILSKWPEFKKALKKKLFIDENRILGLK